MIARLASWAVLHRRWRTRDSGWRIAEAVTLGLLLASLFATFPLLWQLL